MRSWDKETRGLGDKETGSRPDKQRGAMARSSPCLPAPESPCLFSQVPGCVHCRPMALFTKTPDGFFLAHNSTVVGDVVIGELTSFWFGAVVRGDVAQVKIGRRVNVQDCAIIHCDSDVPNEIGDDVTIGHAAICHGRSIGNGTLIGMSATVLSRTRIGNECLIAAGAVVPPDLEVPDRMVVMGVPGKIVRPVKDEELKYMHWLNGHYVELAQKYIAGEFRQIRG
jgi:carbonic anhydrase/acetyltransferase-like protein (isoleucine patch superfamily)